MRKKLLALGLLLGLSATAADLKVAMENDASSLDPMEKLLETNALFAHLLYDPLLRYNSKRELEPRLAEKWTVIDDQTIRFQLRHGVKFHSGNPFTADDVVWSFKRLKDSPNFSALYSYFDGFVKVDDHTVDLKLKDKYPLALPPLAYFFIMDSQHFREGERSQLSSNGSGYAAEHVSGTGPFQLESRKPGEKTVLKRFADHWAPGGNVEQLTLNINPSEQERFDQLMQKQVDLTMPIGPRHINALKQDADHELLLVPSEKVIVLQLNQQAAPQFKDKRVRQAVNLSLNRKDIDKRVLQNLATPAGQLSPPSYLGHHPDYAPEFDLAAAQALMKEAGLENGFRVSFIAPTGYFIADDLLANAIVRQLANIKITAELEAIKPPEYWERFERCEAGLAMDGWIADTDDSANLSETLTATKNQDTGLGVNNCGGFSNGDIDRLLREASTEMNGDKRRALLQKISEIEHDEALIVPLHWQNLSFGYDKKLENLPAITNVKGYPYLGDLKVKP